MDFDDGFFFARATLMSSAVSAPLSIGAERHRKEWIRVSDSIAGLSRALDITEGHPQGHPARTCLIGMRLAALSRLSPIEQADLTGAGSQTRWLTAWPTLARASAGGAE